MKGNGIGPAGRHRISLTSADIVGRRRGLGADYLPEGRPMSGKDFGPAQAPVRTAYGDDAERRRGAPSTQVSDALDEVLAVRAAEVGRAALEVVDVGAGTGGFAVGLARLGHHVTVVDPSPDALAAARWRAAELGVTLTAVQGEAGDLAGLVGEGTADLVVCHNVLEYVDSPASAMAAVARVLRAGGAVSVLAANVVAAVLQRALAGRYEEARRLLTSSAGDQSGPGSAPVPAPAHTPIPAQTLTEHRRFTLAELTALIEGAGLRAGDAQGVRIFAGLLPGVGADPATAEALRDLEAAAADYPALRDIAARLHIFGHR
jgi:2-polyprenyl-3-methyl-5-hydroxy-6-metoxy-1,4-benzoquinol methylase